jgi:secreted trypsin-like serine protease
MLICLPICVFSFGGTWAADFVAPQEPYGATGEVIGAKPATPEEWPATFIFSSAAGGCTGTAIGQRVILTAAHCVSNGGPGTVTVKDKKIAIVCDHHPAYGTANSTTDFALCYVKEPLSGFVFETIDTSLAHARLGQSVTLLGYGCVETGGVDHTYGVLHVGIAEVVRKPAGENVDTVTKGGAAVCFGDSGGAAYYVTRENGEGRTIIGVNSRGDISRYSFISSTATGTFVEWAVDWAQKHGAVICGINLEAKGCHLS